MPNDEAKKKFGASVKFWRRQLGISQEALAERSEMHRTYVCDVERGSRNVSLETIERLARALGISPGILFQNSKDQAVNKQPVRAIPTDELMDILVVEDDPNDSTLTLQALRKTNIANQVHLVHDGAAALDFLFSRGDYANRPAASLPQIILLDINLPKVNGLEVLRRIKNDSHTRSIPVVVLTGSNRNQDWLECQRLGANAYLVKPVDFCSFSEVIAKLNLQWALLKPIATLVTGHKETPHVERQAGEHRVA